MLIHEVVELSRSYLCFDCETTGTNTESDRIVELGFQLYTAEGLQKEWRSLVNPLIPIPAAASDVHHITDADFLLCRKCGKPLAGHPTTATDIGVCTDPSPWPTFRQIAANIAKGFSECDFGGKNIRFDLRILDAEMRRNGILWSYAGARVIDADRLEQLGEPRTLSHLYKKHLGLDLEGAHGALSDVRGTSEVIVAQLTKYTDLPRTLDELHEACWPGWIDTGGLFRYIGGVPTVTFGKWRQTPMARVEQSYWGWICDKSDFSPEIKQIAAQARRGVFPEKKQ